MISLSFLVENWVSLLFGFISTGAIAYCRFSYKKIKELRVLEERQELDEIEELIEKKLEPVLKLHQESVAMHQETLQNFTTIRNSYRFRLIELCQIYLERGSISTKEYSQLSEMWKVYHELGGNSQAEEYYHKVEQLPIKD